MAADSAWSSRSIGIRVEASAQTPTETDSDRWELIAAPAHEHVTGSTARAQGSGDRGDGGIPREVAELVVEPLEAVDVHEQHGGALDRAPVQALLPVTDGRRHKAQNWIERLRQGADHPDG